LKFDVVIIGGGAAGVFCAIEAGKRGRKVLVIERNATVGRKIIISGGGRCNFTNTHTSSEHFISQNPHFCKSALAGYTPADFIELVKKHRIEFYEKKLGQLFCRERSQQIVEMLLKECKRSNVEVRTACSVTNIERAGSFSLTTTIGDVKCERLVIATGGLSFPKIGATDFGYSVARQFGLKVVGTRPSLVPLILENGISTNKLAGISIASTVTTAGHSFPENILFTHRGLSGPAILQISNYWNKSIGVSIDLLPNQDVSELLMTNVQSRQKLPTFLSRFLPDRLVTALCPPEFTSKPINQQSQKALLDVAKRINAWEVKFSGTEGYDKAEVTLGGVSTDELSSQTLEARKMPGLYFIGEVVDVTGWLGGYNFQWAWASGYAAGRSV
jgi:predicted Rossmann fold flavoprotein